MSSRTRAILAILGAVGLLASCDAVDGSEPYALWRVYEHPTGAFHFHYLEPPWEAADGSAADRPVLVLDPSGEDAGPGADVRLEAYYGEATTAAVEVEARRARWQADGYAVDAAEPFENRAGDVGFALRASDGSFEVAEVLLDSGPGVAVLSLWGDSSLGGPDFRLLMKGFEPRRSGSHE
jgi:hypothetical protein